MLSHFILSITDSVPAGLVGRLCASERARLTLCASQQLRGIGDANSKKFIAAGITTLDQVFSLQLVVLAVRKSLFGRACSSELEINPHFHAVTFTLNRSTFPCPDSP